MITRRKFVQTSLAASALALTGCKPDEPPKGLGNPPAGNAQLLLSFVGSTAFVQDGDTIIGVMPSGKDAYYTDPKGVKHSLAHAGYIAGPDFSGPALPSGVISNLGGSGAWKTECLVGKTVTVTGKTNN